MDVAHLPRDQHISSISSQTTHRVRVELRGAYVTDVSRTHRFPSPPVSCLNSDSHSSPPPYPSPYPATTLRVPASAVVLCNNHTSAKPNQTVCFSKLATCVTHQPHSSEPTIAPVSRKMEALLRVQVPQSSPCRAHWSPTLGMHRVCTSKTIGGAHTRARTHKLRSEQACELGTTMKPLPTQRVPLSGSVTIARRRCHVVVQCHWVPPHHRRSQRGLNKNRNPCRRCTGCSPGASDSSAESCSCPHRSSSR